MATGTARAGFSGSDFSLQPFRRGPDSASLGPEAPPERRAQLAQNRAGPGKFRARDREGFRQPVSPFILQTREPRPGRQVPAKRHAHQRKSLDKGPGGLTGHPFGCRLDHLPLRTPPASLLQSPALPCPEFVTRRARGVARLPEVHRRPLLAGAEGRDPEPLLSPPRCGHTSSGSQHSGSLYHFKRDFNNKTVFLYRPTF